MPPSVTGDPPPPAGAPTAEALDGDLVARLRAGDEEAFASVVRDWSRWMLVVARTFVGSAASAEEVVQDTWLAVLRGLEGFEERSTLRTWVRRILVTTAKARGVREHRSVPWGTLEDDGPTVDPGRWRGPEDRWPGGWRSFPAPWDGTRDPVVAAEVRRRLGEALDLLPERQRVVITLRDVLGHSPQEVCRLLAISEGNQRVLLHRARAAARRHLASYLAEEDPWTP